MFTFCILRLAGNPPENPQKHLPAVLPLRLHRHLPSIFCFGSLPCLSRITLLVPAPSTTPCTNPMSSTTHDTYLPLFVQYLALASATCDADHSTACTRTSRSHMSCMLDRPHDARVHKRKLKSKIENDFRCGCGTSRKRDGYDS